MANEIILEKVIAEMSVDFPQLSPIEILVAQVAVRRYCEKLSQATAKLKITKKGKPMYQDSELVKCQECQALGLFAPDLYGNSKFHHKIPSKRVGYFTFTLDHKN